MPRNFLWLVIGVNVLCATETLLKGNLDSPGKRYRRLESMQSLNSAGKFQHRLSGGNNGEGWPLSDKKQNK